MMMAKLGFTQQSGVELLNKLGFHSIKWSRLLSIGVTEIESIAMHVDHGDTSTETSPQVTEIIRRIYTR